AENRLLNGKKLREQLVKDGFLRIYVPAKEKTTVDKKSGKRRGTTKKILADAKKEQSVQESLTNHYSGVVGEVTDLEDGKLKRSGAPKDDFYIVIDRLAFGTEDHGRVIDSLAQAYAASLKYNNHHHSGQALIVSTEGRHLRVSEDFSCSICSYSVPTINSRMFSFNSPVGACPKCNGFGNLLDIDEGKVVPNPELSIAQGALVPFTMPSAAKDRRTLLAYCRKAGIDTHTAWKNLPDKHRQLIWEGSKDFFGVLGLFEYLETKKYKMHVRVFLSRYKSAFTCNTCKGSRLRPEAQQILVQGRSISDLCAMTTSDLYLFIRDLELTEAQREVCRELHRQLTDRLRYLEDVGVGYLTMDRPTKTLS
ncbi:MAG: excinuclease ABC subunit A, partial [Bdellovibrionales bacterium]|nr:excinuclease ABC subunit A [Bdellovibrionales bacterium]